MADLIERRVGHATVPRLPWGLLAPLMRVLPTSVMVRGTPERESASGR